MPLSVMSEQEIGGAGSRVLLRPDDVDGGACLHRGVPGYGRLSGVRPTDNRRLVSISGPGFRSGTPAASDLLARGSRRSSSVWWLAVGFAVRMTDAVRHAL